MPQNISNEDLLKRIAILEEKLRRLETAPKMGNTTQHGGTYLLASEDGTQEFFKFGLFTDDLAGTSFGMRVSGSGSLVNRVIEIGSDGMRVPTIPIVMTPQVAAGLAHSPGIVIVTAGSLTTAFRGQAFMANSTAVQAEVPWATDAATTGEVQLQNFGQGTFANTVTLPANSSGIITFNWLHGQLVSSGPLVILINVRRASGAGNVNIAAPTYLHQTSGFYTNATLAGS